MIDGGYGPTGGNIPFIPISDGAGVVTEIGDSVSKFRKGDIRHSLADIRKIRKMLKYYPLVKFEDGLISTIEWFEKNNV